MQLVMSDRTILSDHVRSELFDQSSAEYLSLWVRFVLKTSEIPNDVIARNVRPTKSDVNMWIKWLNLRTDVNTSLMQDIIHICEEFVNPQWTQVHPEGWMV